MMMTMVINQEESDMASETWPGRAACLPLFCLCGVDPGGSWSGVGDRMERNTSLPQAPEGEEQWKPPHALKPHLPSRTACTLEARHIPNLPFPYHPLMSDIIYLHLYSLTCICIYGIACNIHMAMHLALCLSSFFIFQRRGAKLVSASMVAANDVAVFAGGENKRRKHLS